MRRQWDALPGTRHSGPLTSPPDHAGPDGPMYADPGDGLLLSSRGCGSSSALWASAASPARACACTSRQAKRNRAARRFAGCKAPGRASDRGHYVIRRVGRTDPRYGRIGERRGGCCREPGLGPSYFPEGDQQLSRPCHDRRLAYPAAVALDPFTVPLGQRRMRPMTQP